MQPLPPKSSTSAASVLPPVGPAAPEDQGPDLKDGRFATVMAQTVQPPPPPPPADKPEAPAPKAAADPTPKAAAPAERPEETRPEKTEAKAPAAPEAPAQVGAPPQPAPIAAIPAPLPTTMAPAPEAASSVNALQAPAAPAPTASTLPDLPALPAAKEAAAPAPPMPPVAQAKAPEPSPTPAAAPAPKATLPVPAMEKPESPRPARTATTEQPLPRITLPAAQETATPDSSAAKASPLPALLVRATQSAPAFEAPALAPVLPAPPSPQGVKTSPEAAPAQADTRPAAKVEAPAPPREEAPAQTEAARAVPRVEPVKESVDSRALLAEGEAQKVLPKGDAKAVGTLTPLNAAAPIAATAKAEAAALPPAPNSATAQLEGGVKWMLRTGAPEAQLQLHPENLGQVSIQLKVEGGAVHAKLWVSEPGSMQILQDGRAHLELSLRQQGLQLGSFDLQQGRQPQNGGGFGPPATGASLPGDLAETKVEPALAAATPPLHSRRIELIA